VQHITTEKGKVGKAGVKTQEKKVKDQKGNWRKEVALN